MSVTEHAAVLQHLYIDMLKRGLRNTLYRKAEQDPFTEAELTHARTVRERVHKRFGAMLEEPGAAQNDLRLLRYSVEDVAGFLRLNAPHAHTLVREKALDNVASCVERVIRHHVPGDLMECGVWRGGIPIFMRGLLKAFNDEERLVWVADSFEGLPEPTWPLDAVAHDFWKEVGSLAVSLEEVQDNFRRYALLDNQVRFLKGWFKDTLPTAPIDKLAVLRLDGDYYESTMVALESLYPKLSPGGFVIIDDYLLPLEARRAVHEYRDRHAIKAPIHRVDQCGYWQRLKEDQV